MYIGKHYYCILTVVSSSCNTWSYSDIATQNMMAVTSSKQWIHFFLSDRWPATSNTLKFKFLNEKWTWATPVVLTRVLKISCSVGWYSFDPSRSRSSKKLNRNYKNKRIFTYFVPYVDNIIKLEKKLLIDRICKLTISQNHSVGTHWSG